MSDPIQPPFVALSHERGRRMANFIQNSIQPLGTLSVLDLGCRLGGISLSFAQVSRQVIAIDVIYDQKRKPSWREKAYGATNLFFACGDGLMMPFGDNTFDLVLINGVLEWVGVTGVAEDPRDVQKRCLEEVRRVLKEDGFFYLAIENRLFPGYILKDAHAKVPLVGVLPRKVADGITKRFYQKPYRTYTYSSWGLKKLVRESGFTSCSVFTPIYTYWYPYAIQPISSRRRILQSLANPDLKGATEEYKREALVSKKQRLFIGLISVLGLTKLFSNAFVVIGQK
jgi:SAM-dependent methyltransferase